MGKKRASDERIVNFQKHLWTGGARGDETNPPFFSPLLGSLSLIYLFYDTFAYNRKIFILQNVNL